MSAGGIRNQAGLRVQIDAQKQRQTAKTDFGTMVGKGLETTANVVASAANLAAPFVPGGAVVSAAISGMGQLKSTAQAGMSSSSGGMASNGVGLGSAGGIAAGGGGSTVSGGSAFGAVNAQAQGGSESAQLMLATKEMQEMNQSFNLEYLQLQQKMQGDNRQFTLMSNIMKTKHDTAKNAINNVR